MVVGNIASKDGVANYPFGIEPMYAGLLLTIVLWIIFQIKFNNKFGG
jgi:hypothetical protein